jgi:hypothetical protein
MGTKKWDHPPATLRALLAVYGRDQHVICRPCRRYTPLRVKTKDLDRKFDPCPFRCSFCQRRGEIVGTVPDDFDPICPDLGPPRHRPTF